MKPVPTFVIALLGAAASAVAAPPSQQGGAPPQAYRELTDSPREVVNFNPEPYTSMARAANGDVWAINPYGSLLLKFRAAAIETAAGGSTKQPVVFQPTGLNPVSLALRETASGTEVLVVCSGTHALCVHDGATGQLVDIIRLETTSVQTPGMSSEGADIVVDSELDVAFVSCPDSNAVLKIDLATRAVVNEAFFDVGRRPGYLIFEGGSPFTALDNKILVAMSVTGNGTTARSGALESPSLGIDTIYKPTGTNALPDHDVYFVNANTCAVSPLVTTAGTLLFDIARHPDGKLWILGQDSLNADFRGEPDARGRFARNTLAVANTASGSLPVAADPLKDLDRMVGSSYSAAASINQPRALAFLAQGGATNGIIASPFLDRLVKVTPSGDRDSNTAWLNLAPGSRCSDLKVAGSTNNRLLAMCLGRMVIDVIDVTVAGGPVVVGHLDLGLDPTPAQIDRGRDLFYDGVHSQDSRFSCASCHPRGMSDQLAWQIGNLPDDHKDIMLTQTLFSIADTLPHHWRGERSLPNFKKAFGGLLGDPSEPTDQEMEDLIAFIHSLQAQANPVENPKRILDDSRHSRLPTWLPNLAGTGTDPVTQIKAASPIAGQSVYHDPAFFSFDGKTCAECHPLPTGTSGNFSAENTTGFMRASMLEVAGLRQLNVRGLFEMPVQHPGGGPIVPVNVNGFGATHDGIGESNGVFGSSVFRFLFDTLVFKRIDAITLVEGVPENERAQIFRFVDQFDQGISPAAHWAVRLPKSPPATQPGLQPYFDAVDILMAGSTLGWNDVVAIVKVGGAMYRLSMTEATSGKFRDEWGFLREPAEVLGWGLSGLADIFMIGVPPGSGLRFGIDHDRDGALNQLDPNPWLHSWAHGPYGTAPAGGQQVTVLADLDFASARVAKYHVRFDRPVHYEVVYSSSPALGQRVFESVRGPVAAGQTDFVVHDTFVLPNDLPSGANSTAPDSFSVSLVWRDLFGNTNSVPVPLPSFEASKAVDMTTPLGFTHVDHVVQKVPATPVQHPALIGHTVEGYSIRVAVKENERQPDLGFEPATDALVFVTISVENPSPAPGALPWLPVSRDSSMPFFFASAPNTGSFLTDLGGGVFNYPLFLDPPSNPQLLEYVVSGPIDLATGEVQVDFALVVDGLSPTADVKVTVQGVLRPVQGSNPADLFNKFTMLTLEDNAEIVIQR